MASKTVQAESLIPFAHMAKLPLSLLVVDDDALSRDLLALLLTREGYAVDVLDSGDAAIEALRPQHLPVPDGTGRGIAMRAKR